MMMVEKKRKSKKSRCSELPSSSSRVVLYKTYKILCKLLGCEAICYGPLTKKMAKEGKKVIYASCIGGEKLAVAKLEERSPRGGGRETTALALRKNMKKRSSQDLQKQIVLKILETLEKHDVTLVARGYSKILERGMDFESLLLREDLAR